MKGHIVRCTLRKPRLNLILFLNIYCTYLYSVNSFAVKTCDDIGTFQQIYGIALPMCAEECFRRQRCQIFMFHFGMQHCSLKANTRLQLLQEDGQVCRYYKREDWSLVDLGPCNGHNCSETERCTNKIDDEFKCVKSECPTPVEISDAKLLSTTHSIGQKNRYKCFNEFVGNRNPTITCGDDATWSMTDFRCVNKQSCPVPEQHYFNADLTHVEGSLYTPGTILTFTCRDGYRKTSEEVNITCLESLQWDSDCINCCTENSTHRSDTSCVAIINSGVATSRTDAVKYCKSLGGRLTWTNRDMIDLYDNTTIVLQSLIMSKILTNWYTKCAADNGAFVDDSKSLREKIDEVVDNNWKGTACRYGRMWSPGQPDLDGEDCIVRLVNGSDYGHHDYPCTFVASHKVGFACKFLTPDI